MIIDFSKLRVPPLYPTYPPYHLGDYIEEYFYGFYKRNKAEFDETGYTLIPIFWTSVYITNINRNLIQPYIDALPIGKYFTVSQHDDAVTERLPEDTIRFEAGGNRDGIPIPLICSPLRDEHLEPREKDILCSFVGSANTEFRNELCRMYANDADVYLSSQEWRYDVQRDRFEIFLDITKRSHFTLCPRGYGAQSFRLYEAMQLGSIPVFIYDKEWFPFSSKIDWSEFCVLIHVDEISNLKQILRAIDSSKQEQMLVRGREIYKEYFTRENLCKHILAHLKEQK